MPKPVETSEGLAASEVLPWKPHGLHPGAGRRQASWAIPTVPSPGGSQHSCQSCLFPRATSPQQPLSLLLLAQVLSELGGLCSFHFRKKTGWISQRGEVEGDLARWRCLWVAALFLLSPGSCDMVTEHKQPRASAAVGVVPLVMVSYRKWPPPCTQVFLGPSNNCQGLVWNPQHGLAV